MSYYLIQQIEAARQHHRADLHRGGRRPPAPTTWSGSRCATTPPARTEVVKAQWLFVFIGAAPRTDWLDGVVRGTPAASSSPAPT